MGEFSSVTGSCHVNLLIHGRGTCSQKRAGGGAKRVRAGEEGVGKGSSTRHGLRSGGKPARHPNSPPCKAAPPSYCTASQSSRHKPLKPPFVLLQAQNSSTHLTVPACPQSSAAVPQAHQQQQLPVLPQVAPKAPAPIWVHPSASSAGNTSTRAT